MTSSQTAPSPHRPAHLDARPALRRRLRRRLLRWSASRASPSPACTTSPGMHHAHPADLRGQPAAQHHPPGARRSRGWRPRPGTAPPGPPTSPSASCSVWSPSSASSTGMGVLGMSGLGDPDNFLHLATATLALYFGSVAAGGPPTGVGHARRRPWACGRVWRRTRPGRAQHGGTRGATRGAEFTVPKQRGDGPAETRTTAR